MFPPKNLGAERGAQERSFAPDVSTPRDAANLLEGAAISASLVDIDSPTLTPKTAKDVAERRGGTTRIGETTINVGVLAT
jgi:hypothetical protein